MFESLVGNRAVLNQLAALVGRPAEVRASLWPSASPRELVTSGGRSYLLVGPEGVGKCTAAWELAAALNCTGEGLRPPGGAGDLTGEGLRPPQVSGSARPVRADLGGAGDLTGDPRPCGRCQSCLEWRGGGHRDLKLLSPREETAEGRRRVQGVITVEAAREARDWLGFKPTYAHRVLVIDGAEGLSVSDASDVLLKVLEEPPPRAVIFLVAADEGELAATVRSRCQTFRFHPLTEAELLGLPLLSALPPEKRRAVVALAAGSAGVACALAADWNTVSARRREMVQVLCGIRRAAPPELLERLEALEKWLGDQPRSPAHGVLRTPGGVTPSPAAPSLLAVARSWYRDLRRLKLGAAPFDSTLQAELAAELPDWSLEAIDLALLAVEDAQESLARFVSTRATANVLALRLAGVLPAEVTGSRGPSDAGGRAEGHSDGLTSAGAGAGALEGRLW